MAQIEWTIKASRDFDRLVEYLSDWLGPLADKYIDELLSLIDSLVEFPRRGRAVPEINRAEVRELIFRGYRVIYEIKDERLVLLGIRHGSVNLQREIRRGQWGDV
ncbi:MAG TPA: type II toxin-antitoxin system RelE/ParE family toxin [Dehalococcoidia bacterium]|nr:type II toxin-antitoxin system RelE/ParE family toxin [Dehalococcoidia bacterium]